jgi:hypothetical protein
MPSRELYSQAPHETDDAGFGRRVLDVFVPPISDAHDRRHGYDGPASRRPHGRRRGPADPHDPFQVYLVRVIPLLVGQFREGYAVGDPGVGHDRVQGAVPILDVGHHGIDLIRVGDVQPVVLGLAPYRDYAIGDGSAFLLQYVRHDNAVACSRKRDGRGRADTYAGAGDQGCGLSRVPCAHSITSPELGPSVCPT